MILKAKLATGGSITLSPVEAYDRVYLGSNGRLYMDDRENPQPVYDQDAIPPWLYNLVDRYTGLEINHYEIILLPLKIRPEWGEVGVDTEADVAYFYEWGFNGNQEGITHSLEEMMVAIYEAIVPLGLPLYVEGQNQPYHVTSWHSRDYRYFGMYAQTIEGEELREVHHKIDWERTLERVAQIQEARRLAKA